MGDVFAAKLTELVPLQPVRVVLLILAGRIVSLLAHCARQIDNVSHVVSREAHNATSEELLLLRSNA
jgi:hypothetical protein